MSPSATGTVRRALPLVWRGPIWDPSGYADEARGFLLALDRAGYEPVARPMTWGSFEAGVSGELREVLERAAERPDPAGDVVHVVHHIPMEHFAGSLRGVAFRTMFETDRIPAHWPRLLLEADVIWVPTEFNVETFQRGGIPAERLRVLPGTLDFDLFDPAAVEPWPLEKPRSFAFLANFDFSDRKGWDVLLDGWAEAFDPDDDVCLILKAGRLHGLSPDEIEERIHRQLGGRETAPIVLNQELLPAAEMPRLYTAADAYVLPTRGEGWGRPFMEAMAMGLPTIASRFSAHLAFMNDANAWLVDGELVDVAGWDGVDQGLYRGHHWFQADRDALAEALRAVHRGGPEVAARAGGARAFLLENFGPEVVAARIAELVEELLERRRQRLSRPLACVWRGEWGSHHSLSIVNDGNLRALSERHTLELQVPSSAPAPLDVPGVAAHWPPSFEAPSSGPFVLYQPWEYGRVPERWVEEIRRKVDEVWTPSESCRRAFVESGVAEELVHVVPNGVDLERFSPAVAPRLLPTRRATVFLFVGGPTFRKGIDVLLEGYARAFTAADDVCLVLKLTGAETVYQGYPVGELVDRHRARADAPEIVLLDAEVPFSELPSLYRAADALVQPYRGEGFCLPALEALACGVPVIATDGGPTDDFVTEASGWRVPAARVPCRADAFPPELRLAGDGFLLEPDPGALAAILREAVDPERRREKAAGARAEAERFGWAQAAAAAERRLAALAGRTPVRRLPRAIVPERRRVLFAAFPDWERPHTWAPAVRAYAEAFGREDDVTLVLPAADETRALELVSAELGAAVEGLADVALADANGVDPVALELAADAVICGSGDRPARAARVCAADPDELRAVVAARGA